MQIGPHVLANNLILAPMAGITDRPFRALCREFGAGLAVSEMTSAKTSVWASAKSTRRLDFEGEAGPISVQIMGGDPLEMADAARMNVDRGAQIIDINMGCPARKVCKVVAGSTLLRHQALAVEIMRAVVKAVPVPVTLKMRTGWDPDSRNAPALARIAEDCGIQAIAIHGRTRQCGYSGRAEMDTVARIKQDAGIPIIANGDIDTPERVADVLAQTGVDAVMIGRGAQGRPWIFADILHHRRLGQLRPERNAFEIQLVLERHLRSLYDFYGETQGMRVARKHIAWYSLGLPNSAQFRALVNQAASIERQQTLIRDFFNRTRELAA